MERITRDDLKNMRTRFIESQKERRIATIVEQVRRSAESGHASYTYIHENHIQQLFSDPLEVVQRLRDVFVDVDIVYAEPYISIRWN